MPVRPCSKRDVSERCCNIPYMKAAHGADAARQRRRHDQDIRVGPSRSAVHIVRSPGRSPCGRPVTNPHRAKTPREYLAIDAVAMALSHCQLAGPDLWLLSCTMTKISYAGYRFPPEIIQQAIWLYVKFTLSFRDVEDL